MNLEQPTHANDPANLVWVRALGWRFESAMRRLFGPQRYRAVPWTFWEVVLLAPTVISGVWHGLFDRKTVEHDPTFVRFNQVAMLLVLLLPFVLVVVRGALPYQMGVHPSHFWRNALVGYIAFYVAVPAVLITNVCALQFFRRTPHSIETSLIESPTALNFGVAAFSAVIVAPIIEELAFRGILLPWLRRIVGPWPAILLCSAIFAIAHFDAWPAPIALFVLALFLGYLAHRTTSIVGPIVLHATFNAANLAFLYIVISTKAIPLD
jgi:membrane protease YdiL (CAAX protease family)